MAGIGDFLRCIVASELRGEWDAELFKRFLVNREEAAFTAIVRRHGAMVYQGHEVSDHFSQSPALRSGDSLRR